MVHEQDKHGDNHHGHRHHRDESNRHHHDDHHAKRKARQERNHVFSETDLPHPGAVSSHERASHHKSRSNRSINAPGAHASSAREDRAAHKKGHSHHHHHHHHRHTSSDEPVVLSISRETRELRKNARHSDATKIPSHAHNGVEPDVVEEQRIAKTEGANKKIQQQMDVVPTLKATAAPDAYEIEAARQQGRQEERAARKQKEVETADVAEPLQDDNKTNIYLYILAAFCCICFVIAIIAGVVIWKLLSEEPTIQAPSGNFDPPTEEDCQAISEGRQTGGQAGSTVDSFGVNMDFTMPSNFDINFLQTELAHNIQSDVLPLLVGCGLASIQHNISIENALLKAIMIGDPAACISNSPGMCSSVQLQIDLFLTDADVLTEEMLDLLTETFQDEGILELLSLESPVIGVDFLKAYEILPSIAPTSSPTFQALDPTIFPTFEPATEPPSQSPTIATLSPSASPSTPAPTLPPTPGPTAPPTHSPTPGPTPVPTPGPTVPPTPPPTPGPTPTPTPEPTVPPTPPPTPAPSRTPTPDPTTSPTSGPTLGPTPAPTTAPTSSPTLTPKLCFQTNSELKNAVGDWLGGLEAAIESQYGLISDWCFDGVTSMEGLFYQSGGSTFNEDLSRWDVSAVTNMRHMFKAASSFNQDLPLWDVSLVTNMEHMFEHAIAFNGDVTTWITSSLTNPRGMFGSAYAFNQDISSWDVSHVPDMNSFFSDAKSFNQDLSSWDVSSVTIMRLVFEGTTSFNQNLCEWGSKVPSADWTLSFSGSNCPEQSNPNMSANPPGPFCHVCT